MGAILDRGSLLFASAAVLAATLLLKFTAPFLPISFFTPLLVLAVVYVPGVLLLATLLGRLGGLGVVFQRDYSPLLTCTAWPSRPLRSLLPWPLRSCRWFIC